MTYYGLIQPCDREVCSAETIFTYLCMYCSGLLFPQPFSLKSMNSAQPQMKLCPTHDLL